MKIFITKFKSANNRTPNYFSKPAPLFVDCIVADVHQVLEDAFGTYTDELTERDNPMSFISSDYNCKLSLLAGMVSQQGKNLEQFFDPETDNYIPVGFKIAYGTDENNIERGDFIDPGSIKINWRKDDSGWILSYTAIGPEEMAIRAMEQVDTIPLSETFSTLCRFFLSGLVSTSNFPKLKIVNFTVLQFQTLLAYEPVVSWYLYNKYLAGAEQQNIWFILSGFLRDIGMGYAVEHPLTCNPAALDQFDFKIFFPGLYTSVPEPVILKDADYFTGTTLDYSKPHFMAFYVSYTFQDNSDVDILTTAYRNRNTATIGYSNIDGNGFQNDVNNVRRIYSVDRYIRNGEVIPDADILFNNSPRVFIGTYPGTVNGNTYNFNIGISIGRCLVKNFTVVRTPGPFGQTTYSDTGFNQIIQATALREYSHLVSGVKQFIDIPVEYQLNSPHKLNRKFPLRNKTWRIIRVTDRDHWNGSARLLGVQV
jgi:hypothetical protein